MMFKEQARVEMPLKVYKVPASQKAVPTRLKYQQHCDFLFCLYHSLVYNEPFTCLGQGSCHFPLWFEKVCFRVVCLMLYTQELSIRGVPKNLQEIRKIRLELLKIKSFLWKLRGWRGTGIPKASKERKKHANFQPWNWLPRNISGLSHQRGQVNGTCCFHTLARGIYYIAREIPQRGGKHIIMGR